MRMNKVVLASTEIFFGEKFMKEINKEFLELASYKVYREYTLIKFTFKSGLSYKDNPCYYFDFELLFNEEENTIIANLAEYRWFNLYVNTYSLCIGKWTLTACPFVDNTEDCSLEQIKTKTLYFCRSMKEMVIKWVEKEFNSTPEAIAQEILCFLKQEEARGALTQNIVWVEDSLAT